MPPRPKRSCNSRSTFVGIVDSSYSRVALISNCTQDSESHTMRLKRGTDIYFLVKDSRNNSVCQYTITMNWLLDPEVMISPDFDPMDAVEIFDIVNRQDWEVCELAQMGMGSKAYRSGGVYVPEERHIRAFADFVLERVG